MLRPPSPCLPWSVLSAAALWFLPCLHALPPVWSAASGKANEAAKWSTEIVPSGSDLVQVGSGAVEFDTSLTFGALEMTGGTLHGSSTLTLGNAGHSKWHGGSMTFSSGGGVKVDTDGTLEIGNGVDHDFSGTTLTNLGVVNWNSGRLRSGNAGRIRNFGTWNDAASTEITNAFGGTALTFTNEAGGSYHKGGPGTTTYDVAFNNHGAVTVTTGTLALRAGGASSGSYAASGTGAEIVFDNGHAFGAGASLGAGVRLRSGEFTLSGSLATGGAVLEGGRIKGSPTLTGGTLSWTGGDLIDLGTSLTLENSATLAVENTIDHHFNGRSIVNHGTIAWSNGNLRSASGGGIENHGVIVNSAAGATDLTDNGGGFAFSNATGGQIQKTGTGTMRFTNVALNNAGDFAVADGDLELSGGGTNSGTLSAAAGTEVRFTSHYNVAAGGVLNGAGKFRIIGGTFNHSGDIGIADFNLEGGQLGGSHNLKGNLKWQGGIMNAGGTTTIEGTGLLSVENTIDHHFNGRSIVNHGTIAWSNGNLRSASGGGIENHGVIVNSAAGATDLTDNGGGFAFSNATGGQIQKTGTGTMRFTNVALNNAGDFAVADGDLELSGGGTNSGTLSAAAGTEVRFTSHYNVAAGGVLNGAGKFRIIGGTFNHSGDIGIADFNLEGGQLGGSHNLKGNLKWQGGIMNAGGTTTIEGTGLLSVENTIDHHFNGRSIVNHGTIAWSNGNLRSASGGGIENHGVIVNSAAGATDLTDNGGGFNFSNVAGAQIRKTGTGTLRFTNVALNNAGEFEVDAGVLEVAGGGVHSGLLTVASGAEVRFTSHYNVAAGGGLTGLGRFRVTGGTFTHSGNLSAADFNLEAGQLAGTHTVNGRLRWTGGNLNAGGTTTIDAAGTFLIDDPVDHDFNLRTIANHGTTRWNGGNLRSGNNGAFENHGTFTAEANGEINAGLGGTFVFTNQGSGTLRKISAGQTDIRAGFVNRAGGVLDVEDGVLALHGNSVFEDESRMIGLGLLRLAGGLLNANGALALHNFEITGGSIAGSHAFSGHTKWIGGDFNSTGTTTVAATSVFDIESAADHNFDRRAFVNWGVMNWRAGRLRGGNHASITNHGIFNDYASTHVQDGFGGGTPTFTNAGTGVYNKLGAGTTTFDIPFSNHGALVIHSGAMVFNGAFTNTGSLVLVDGASAQFASALNFGTSALLGTGTLQASSVTAGGIVAPGASAGALGVTGDFTLLGTSMLIIELGGLTPGAQYDFLDIGGNGLLAGTLAVNFINGFESSVLATHTFTVLSAANVSGAFGNIASGQRLFTSDGLGSFRVDYGSGLNAVTLSDFESIPEPSTYALMAFGGALLVASRRKRRRS